MTVLAGAGNSFGGLGVQGGYYLAAGRVSVFAGVGYYPGDPDDDRLPSGVAGAVGARGFTKGLRHRGFLELSVAPITNAWATRDFDLFDGAILYGPSAQGGYQFVGSTGFTIMISVGVGYARWSKYDLSYTSVTGGLGLGYTRR